MLVVDCRRHLGELLDVEAFELPGATMTQRPTASAAGAMVETDDETETEAKWNEATTPTDGGVSERQRPGCHRGELMTEMTAAYL